MVSKTCLTQIGVEWLWQVPEYLPGPPVVDLLKAKNHLTVLQHGQPPYRVVVGVPHQVPSGIWRICDERLDEHGQINDRKGDDNVASIALVIFSRLASRQIPCKLVIMARATTQDPNKVLDSPYCQEIFSEQADLLFECHASSGRRRLDLELSAGSNRITQTVLFGQDLASRLAYRYSLGIQTQPGCKKALIFARTRLALAGELQLPATKTVSLQAAGERGIAALHLEAKPTFRVRADAPNAVSPDGQVLGRAVAETIIHLHQRVKQA